MKTSTPEKPKTASPPKILLMGAPGTRKTTLLLQFPGIHVMDCDRNLDGPETYIRKTMKLPLSFTYDDIRRDESEKELDVKDCYNRLCDKLKLFKSDKDYMARQGVGVDSLSHVNEFIIRHTLAMQNKTTKSYEMEARDWSPFKSFAYLLLVSRLEETGKYIICTAHEAPIYGKPAKDDMMNPPIESYIPWFQGKIGEMLGAFFTDVWRLEVRQAPGGKLETWLLADKHPKCDMLKNSFGLPKELNITPGYSVLAPYLVGRL